MFLKRQRFGDLHGRAIADDFLVEQSDETAFGKIVDLPANLAVGIGGHILVHPADERGDAANVLRPRIADFQPALAEPFGRLAAGRRLLPRCSSHW